MKVTVVKIVVPVLVLMAFGAALSRKQTTPTPEMRDYHYAEPFRSSEGGKTLTQACGNCHSNQTNLPWYGHVAPISWWIEVHVREGRQALNFNEWMRYSTRRRRDELESICGVLSNGRMPPPSYRLLHPESRLAAQDKKMICAWAAIQSQHER